MAKYLGDKIDSALYYKCDNVPQPGHALYVDGAGKLISGALGAASLAGFDQLLFGIPTDGAFTADGITGMVGTSQFSPDWQSQRAYRIGDQIVPAAISASGKQLWVCTTAGTSGASAPSWPSTPAQNLTTQGDGTVTWTFVCFLYLAAADWQTSHAYSSGTQINPSGSSANTRQVWTCTTAGTSAAGQPSWPLSPTPGVTTQTDGTVVWAFFGYLYTLTRDVNFSRLVVQSGVTIFTNGFRLFANNLVLNGTAVIQNDGGSGGAGGLPSTTNPGASGAAAGKGSISYTASGGTAGGTGGDFGKLTAPTKGLDGSSLQPALGGTGGRGGDGNAATVQGAPAGTSALVVAPTNSVVSYPKIIELHDPAWGRGIAGGNGGTGGGGGGYGAGTGAPHGGGGGGGGGAGGICFVACGTLDVATGAWTGRISANGGAGGLGAPGATGGTTNGGTGGAGGGGGGGAAILFARQIVGSVNANVAPGAAMSASVAASPGSAGSSGATTNATAASPGIAVVVNLSQPFAAATEYRRAPIFDARPIYRKRPLSGTRDSLKP